MGRMVFRRRGIFIVGSLHKRTQRWRAPRACGPTAKHVAPIGAWWLCCREAFEETLPPMPDSLLRNIEALISGHR
jgi:hypothetical protein